MLATVGGRPVAHPASYVALLTLDTPTAPDLAQADDWEAIRLASAGRPTPWTDGGVRLQFSRHAGVLQRGSDYVRLPAGLTARIAAGDSLTRSSGGFASWTVVLAAAGAAALGAAAVFVRVRPRRLPRSLRVPSGT